MEFLTCLITQLIDLIAKIQVIIDVDAQKFNTAFISYEAARGLNF